MVKPDEDLVACGMILAHRRREVLLERAEEIRTGFDHSPPDGRVVAVYVANNQDLNRWMVLNGWAVAYRRYALSVSCHAHDTDAGDLSLRIEA
ncbi:MAG: hypothetical protein ACREDT_06875 [Methylocella sp.]